MSYYIPWNSLTYFIIPFQYFQTHGFFFCHNIEPQNSLYLSLQVWLVANKKDHSVWVGQVASIRQPGREVVVCWSERGRDDGNKKSKVSPPSDVVNKKSPSSTSVVWPCHSPKPLRLIDLLAEYCCVIDVRKVWVQIKADLSCPAVSQICSFIFCPDTWNTFGLTNWKPKKCLHLNDSRSKLHPDGVRTVSHD